AQVAGRRADKLGHFVLHLELTAIHSQKMDLSLPCKISANASTVRVFPVPVGPSSRNTPTGRPSGRETRESAPSRVAGQPRGSLAHSAGSRARAGVAGGLGWVGRAIEVCSRPRLWKSIRPRPRAQKS